MSLLAETLSHEPLVSSIIEISFSGSAAFSSVMIGGSYSIMKREREREKKKKSFDRNTHS